MSSAKTAPSAKMLSAMTVAIASCSAWCQDPAIERTKATDIQLSCAQMHAEMGEMDKVVTQAKEAQASGSQTATAGAAGKVAAEVAGQTGLFGRVGGLAGSLFGKAAAKMGADNVQQSGQAAADQANDRARQATARKEQLATLFADRGCQANNLEFNPSPVAGRPSSVAPEASAPKRQLRSIGPILPEADPDVHFSGKMGGTFGKDVTEILPQYKRVAVPGFRVAFVTKDSVSAQVRASGGAFGMKDKSGASVTVNASLAGVDGAAMQAVVDKAYANFLEQLRLAGREVVPADDLREFLSGLQVTPSSAQSPFTKEVGTQTVQLLSPTGLPLWFIHGESGWSDRSGFDLGNWRRYGEYTKKLNCIVVVPLIVVNFVSMASSGNQSGMVAREATADAIPGMAVRTFMSLYASPVEEGAVLMKKGITSDLEFGNLKEVATEDNKAVKGVFDALGALGGLANAGGSNRLKSTRVMQANDADYRVAAEDVLARSTGTFAKLFQKYPAR